MENDAGTARNDNRMYWGMIAIVTALLVLSVFTQGFGIIKTTTAPQGNSSNAISESALKTTVEQYINKNLLSTDGLTAQVTDVSAYDDYLNIMKLDIKQGDQTVQSNLSVYASKDGQTIIIGGQAFNTSASLSPTQQPPAQQNENPPPAQIQKSDKPKAQAFVMSFCPYGLQFLKAYVPVIELLGGKADLEVRFVDYAMHGKKELDANNYLYCAQKEENAKFAGYLRCFVEAGDYQGCVATAGLDSAIIQTCVSQVDTQYSVTALYNDQSTWVSGQFPQYPVDSTLNDQYGVQGSPTFVLNGQQVQVSRTAEAIKQAICGAFTTRPSECSTVLSSSSEAPGLGKIGTSTPNAAGSSGGCGG